VIGERRVEILAREVHSGLTYRYAWDEPGTHRLAGEAWYMTQWPSGGVTGFGDMKDLRRAARKGELYEVVECEMGDEKWEDFDLYA